MTIHFSHSWRTVISLGFVLTVLVGCAQYQTVTNKAVDYNDQIGRLFVWTAVGEVPMFRGKSLLAGESFEDRFNSALRHAFSEQGIIVDVRVFSPKNDTFEQLSRFEEDMAPAARLLIWPARYRTFSYNGGTSISEMWLDMSLYDIRENRRVWRGQLYIAPGLDPTAFTKGGAQQVSAQIIAALKKDNLIAPAIGSPALEQAPTSGAD